MKKSLSILITVVFTIMVELSIVSCTDRISAHSLINEKEKVEISLNLSFDDFHNISCDNTRAPKLDTLSFTESSNIKNLWILQYDGTQDTDTLLFCEYFEDYNSIPSTIKVIGSGTRTNRLYFIANTFDPTIAFGSAHTLKQAKEKTKKIIREADILQTEVIGGLTYCYPMMNGYFDGPISSGGVSCTMERSIARIDCNVKCNVSGMIINSVTVCSVPDEAACLTKDYVRDFSLFPDKSTINTIDYSVNSWSDGIPTDNDPGKRQFTFYVPCNKRGISSNNTQKFKPIFAPDKATYIRIDASFTKSGVQRNATYSFYLGANLTNDYNLLPNHRYFYDFVIDDIGNQDNDSRVAMDFVDFRNSDKSNCYMIHPSATPGTWRSFLIPIKRVYDYWHDYAGDANNSLEISTCPGWKMDVIWSDVKLYIADSSQSISSVPNCNFKWVKSGKKYLNGTGEQVDVAHDYFEFEIPAELTSANILVGIRRYTDETCSALNNECIWSWHLWVTKYQPDKCNALSPVTDIDGVETQFVYSVPGGSVHRYKGAIWNNLTGDYKGRFIMDRNLGASETNRYIFDEKKEIFYEFGRKDPMPYYQLYNVLFSRAYIRNGNTGSSNNVSYSINKPTTYIWNYNWVGDAKDISGVPFKSTNIIWQDTKTVLSDKTKSIFDPCPVGWKVPDKETWDDFSTSTLIWNNPYKTGGNYFPNGANVNIFYPMSGYIHPLSSSSVWGGYVHNWSNKRKNDNDSYIFYFDTYCNKVASATAASDTNGGPVRCVQDKTLP